MFCVNHRTQRFNAGEGSSSFTACFLLDDDGDDGEGACSRHSSRFWHGPLSLVKGFYMEPYCWENTVTTG